MYSTFSVFIPTLNNLNDIIKIPVIEDTKNSKYKLPTRFRQLLVPSDFEFKIDDVISCADRHLFIRNRSNTLEQVKSWINLLRWEFVNFWEVNARECWYDDRSGTRNYSHEHPRRSGEIFAEGLALLFLEKRLNIPRSMLYFNRGSDARPDYILDKPSKQLRRKLLLPKSRQVIGLEVRSREGWKSIRSSDHTQIDNKKRNQNVSATLAFYACYGRPSKDNTYRTHILLGDPESENNDEASLIHMLLVLIGYYKGVSQRLGLWEFEAYLTETLTLLSNGRLPHNKVSVRKLFSTAVTENFNGAIYKGRFFSDLLLARHTHTISQAEYNNFVRAQNYGRVHYRGINLLACKLICECKWDELILFFDDNSIQNYPTAENYHVVVGGDGVITIDFGVPDKDSIYARAIISEAR